MEQSIFTEPGKAPGDKELEKALGKTYTSWNEIRGYVMEHCPAVTEEWNYSKFGWNYRINDKKRAIIYLMPGEQQFKASFALGQKAVAEALAGDLTEDIKAIISTARIYAEGTGVRIIVNNKKTVRQILKLVDIKLKY